MPCQSAGAIARKKAARRVREAAKRQAYQESKTSTVRLALKPLDGWTTKDWSDKTQLVLVGEPEQHHALPNLTVTDLSTGQVVMQRFAPSSQELHRKAKASGKKGKILLDKYLQKKDATKKARGSGGPSQSSAAMNKRNLVEHHLGIWHSRGEGTLGFTSETTNFKYRDEAFALLKWAKEHADLVLGPIIGKIDKGFDSNLNARASGREWLAGYFGNAVGLLHNWWTTVAFFIGFAEKDGVHIDKEDCVPSLLFNFGEDALLALPQFGISIRVPPHSIVLLNSHTYYHRTLRTADGDKRWAFSGFFRKSIFDRKPISAIAKDTLDAILGYR